jgi:hypothetical protein
MGPEPNSTRRIPGVKIETWGTRPIYYEGMVVLFKSVSSHADSLALIHFGSFNKAEFSIGVLSRALRSRLKLGLFFS